MQQAGMKPVDALVSATLPAAKALGGDARLGSIEDLKRLADKKLIRAVFLGGKLVTRQPGDSYPRTILTRNCLTVGQ